MRQYAPGLRAHAVPNPEFPMRSHGSTERSEGYPWNGYRGAVGPSCCGPQT